MSRIAGRHDLLVHVRETFEAQLDGKVAASDHDSDACAPHHNERNVGDVLGRQRRQPHVGFGHVDSLVRVQVRLARANLGDRHDDLVARDIGDRATDLAVVEQDRLVQAGIEKCFGQAAPDVVGCAGAGDGHRLHRAGEDELISSADTMRLLHLRKLPDGDDIVSMWVNTHKGRSGRHVRGLLSEEATRAATAAEHGPQSLRPVTVAESHLIPGVATASPRSIAHSKREPDRSTMKRWCTGTWADGVVNTGLTTWPVWWR